MSLNFPPYYAESGVGWRLAGSLIQAATEIHASDPEFTCLGTLGNAAHAAENMSSDHNPFILDGGVGIVRAIDIGGPDAKLKALRQHIWDMYAAQDNRLYPFGYSKGTSDNQINNWYLPFGHHKDTGDAGHLHLSVTQKDGNHPSTSGYVAAIDDRRTWGISSGVVTAGSGTPIPAPAAGTKFGQGAGVPAFIANEHDYLGSITGPNISHGGINDQEKAAIQLLQRRLIACGFVPGQSNPMSGWADGIYDTMKDRPGTGATSLAVKRFHDAWYPNQPEPYDIYADDWRVLFNHA